MSNQRLLYHGTNGDNVLKIIHEGKLRPNQQGIVQFSQNTPASVLMHGPDKKRKAAFAIKVLIDLPSGATCKREATAGVVDTVTVITPTPLPAQVLELYVRDAHGTVLRTITGVAAITAALNS
jgi:hypothetical protein